MRPIERELPANPADYTLGQLIFWHFFRYGTRPSGDPSNKIGRRWARAEAVRALKPITDRALRNWINDSNPPKEIVRLCEVLFGDNKRWDEARIFLQRKFDEATGGGTDNRPADGNTPSEVTFDPAHGPEPAGTQQAADNAEAEDTGKPSGPEPGPDAEDKDRPPASRALTVVPTYMLSAPAPAPRSLPRYTRRAFAAGIAVLLGIYGWVQYTRHAERAGSGKPTSTATAPAPKAPQSKVTEPPRPPVKVATAPAQPAPPETEIAAPAPPPPAPPLPNATPSPAAAPPVSEEEQKRIKERQEAFDLAMKQREEEALRLDAEDGDPGREQRERDAEARTLAGLGYRLRENMSAPVSPFASMLKANVAECARACEDQKCDGFAFYRNQYGPASRQPRYCYLFRGPFIPSNNPGYVFGERAAPDPPSSGPMRKGAYQGEAPIRFAQAGPGTVPPAADDGITRCAGGPVKVTGFKLACDTILSGGTTLGSTRLSYTVANINECAAKCRPVAACTAFTFNSGDPDRSHACVIFGGRPEGRDSAGWIAGQR